MAYRKKGAYKNYMQQLLNFSIIFLVLLFIGINNVWAGGFGVGYDDTLNQIAMTTNSETETPSIDSNGLAEIIRLDGTSIETIAFTLKDKGVTLGSYTIDLGIVVADVNNDRRIESYLAGVQVNVTSGTSTQTSVTIPAGAELKITGRNSSGDTTVNTTINNDTVNGPITSTPVGSGVSVVTYDISGLVSKVQAKFSSLPDIDNFVKDGQYTYTILIKSANVAIGYINPSSEVFTAFQKYPINSSCGTNNYNLDNIALLTGSPLSSVTGNVYVIRGGYSVNMAVPTVRGKAPQSNAACSGGDDDADDGFTDTDDISGDPNDEDVIEKFTGDAESDPDRAAGVIDTLIEDEDNPESINAASTLLANMISSDDEATQNAAITVLSKLKKSNAANLLAKMTKNTDTIDQAANLVAKMTANTDTTDDAANFVAAMTANANTINDAANLVAKMTANTNTINDAANLVAKMTANSNNLKQAANLVAKMSGDNIDTAVDLLKTMIDPAKSNKLDKAANLFATMSGQSDETTDAAVNILVKAGASTMGRIVLQISNNGQVTQAMNLTGRTFVSKLSDMQDLLGNEDIINTIKQFENAQINLKGYMEASGHGWIKNPTDIKSYLDNLIKSTRATEDSSIEIDSETGIVYIKEINIPGVTEKEDIYGVITDIVINATPSENTGILIIRNGLAINLCENLGDSSSMEINFIPMTPDVDGLLNSLGDTASIDTENGVLIYKDNENHVKSSALFGWSAGEFSATAKKFASFDVSNGCLQIKYDDGSTQNIAPAIGDFDKLNNFLTGLIESEILQEFSLDRTTGILSLTIGGIEVKFKPDYMIYSLTNPIFIIPMLDEYGIQWEVVDANGDGIDDLQMTTTYGSQILYSIVPSVPSD